MKKFKKIMAILVAAVMIMATMVPAWATQTGGSGGKITISVKPKDIDNIDLDDKLDTGETYYAYKIFDYTNTATNDPLIGTTDATIGPGDGEGIAYTIAANSPWITTAKINTELAAYLTFTPSADGTVYNVERIDAKNTEPDAREIARILNSFLTGLGSNNITDGTNTTSLAAAEQYHAVDAGSPYTGDKGYYLITSTLGSNLILATSNIDITEKNNYPAVYKKIKEGASKVDTTDVCIGDTVTFELTTVIPAESTNEVVLHDAMSAGLTLVDNSFKVAVDTGSITTSNYTITRSSSANGKTDATGAYSEGYVSAGTGTLDAYTFNPNSYTETLRIVFNDTYVKNLAAKTTVTVTYDAVLNENAVLASTGNDNSVQLKYSNYVTPVKSVNVKTYNGALYKYDGADGTALANAKFTGIRSSDSSQMYFTLVKAGDTTHPVVYKYSKSYTSTTTDVYGTASRPLVTPASGAIMIVGLDAGSYVFTETSAPDGYYKLADTQTLTVSAASANLGTDPTQAATSGSAKFTHGVTDTDTTSTTYQINEESIKFIQNKSGKELPSTGGMGTTVLYIVGGMLVILAGAYLFFSRKRTA